MGTLCNYCIMKGIEQQAEKNNNAVSKISTYDPEIQTPDMNGVNVYVHPEDIDITDENKYHYFHTWFMNLPDKCFCSS